MTDNRFNSLNDYEQLKRKNRRRLVGAFVMVVLAGLLLAKVLNQNSNHQETAQSISINGDASDAGAASETIAAPQVAINNQAASADDASDLSPAAVLEPAPEGNTRSTELANPLAGGTQAQAASAEQPPAAVSEPAQASSQAETPKPAVPAASRTVPAPAVIINNNRAGAADNQAAEKAAAEKQAAQRAAEARKREAAAKQAEQRKAQAAREQARKQAGTAQKAPQTSAQSGSKADPQAILEGRAGAVSSGTAIIQAGAYSNQEQARQIQQKLSAAGVSAHISEAQTSKGNIYRVRTGSYASRAAANQALQKIRAQGIDAMVIGQ